MTMTASQTVVLDVHKPKKDAVVGVLPLVVQTNEVGIAIGSTTALTNEAEVVATLQKMHTWAQSQLSTFSGATTLDALLGAGDGAINVGTLTPDTGAVLLSIGATVVDKEQSHFLDRTFKRLIERLLEESK